jgi:hypothetical protein
MVSAWVLVTLAALGSVACGYGAVRLARAPKQVPQPGSHAAAKPAAGKQARR